MPKFVKGFTLVELMVVISIIAILAVVGLTLYNDIQKGARDARRKADIVAISNALEAHYKDPDCSATAASPYCFVNATNAPVMFASGTVPANPTPGGADYSIRLPVDRTRYTACALLENNNGNSSDAGDDNTFTSASGAAANYYCMKYQQ